MEMMELGASAFGSAKSEGGTRWRNREMEIKQCGMKDNNKAKAQIREAQEEVGAK
jgi:hypothetical protein